MACTRKKPALFIDRDGVIIEDGGYIYGTNLKFIDKTFELVKKYQNKNYFIIVVTNQAGVAKGYFTEDDIFITNETIQNVYKSNGLVIDKFIYCPYHEEASIDQYKKFSIARKPEAGMILKACELFKIDLKNSIMYGNNPKTDIIKLPYLKSVILEAV